MRNVRHFIFLLTPTMGIIICALLYAIAVNYWGLAEMSEAKGWIVGITWSIIAIINILIAEYITRG